MGTFVVASTKEVFRIRTRVLVNGSVRSDVFCPTVTLGMGTAGSTASLQLPALYWDGGKDWLRGAKIEVRAGYGSSLWTVFAGYVTRSTGRMGDMVTCEAVSLLGMADTVYLGQSLGDDMVAEYPAKALLDGIARDTGWTIKTILRDIFGNRPKDWRGGGGSLPSQWRARLELGSLAVLSSSWNSFPIGDQVFRQATLRDGLDQLLGIVGTVSMRETFFEGGSTRLEFFELADSSAPVRQVRVVRRGQGIAGTNVLSITHDESAEDVRTRMIGLGAPRKWCISVTTDHPTAPLEKDWNEALEAAVLADPESAQQADDERASASDAKARVGRNYVLPEVLKRLVIAKDTGLELSDGSKVGVHVWKFGRTRTWNPGTETWTSTLDEAPKLVQGVDLDLENWRLRLRKPAINFVSGSVDGGANVIDVYEIATIGITLSVEGPRLKHDTGVRGNRMGFDGIDGAGLAEVICNESFAYIAAGADDIDGHSFDAWVWTGSAWTFYLGENPIQDDSEPLRRFTELALREKRDVRTAYQVDTPWWTNGYRIGERVEIVGQDDFVYGTHQIQSVTYDLTHDHGTSFSTDSAVPMVANDILGSGG